MPHVMLPSVLVEVQVILSCVQPSAKSDEMIRNVIQLSRPNFSIETYLLGTRARCVECEVDFTDNLHKMSALAYEGIPSPHEEQEHSPYSERLFASADSL
jgi:hypothetical protein